MLLGVPCRYDGQSKAHPLARTLCKKHHVSPCAGDLRGTAHSPASGGDSGGPGGHPGRPGRDGGVPAGGGGGAGAGRLTGAEAAVLKERSPSCGSGAVYDGTFSGTLTAGWGVAAGLLREQGLRVVGESRLEELLRQDVR